MVQETPKFIPILRILEVTPFNKRSEAYIEKLIENLKSEGYLTDAKLVEEKLKWMRGDDVAMATMDNRNFFCSECLSEMKWNGNVCLSNPVQYAWTCPNCQKTEYLSTELHLRYGGM